LSAPTLNYLRRLDEVLERLEQDHGLSKEDISWIMDQFFKDFKDYLADPRLPTIKISNFGKFRPSEKKLNYRMWRAIQAYKAGKLSREVVVSVIKHLWPIKQRLYDEKAGKETYRTWNKKKDKGTEVSRYPDYTS